jgi:thiol-disulfide isomerase/thioredoxin
MKLIPLFFVLFFFAFSNKNKNLQIKYQLVVFEGSDWCVNCRRLEKNVLSDSSFISFTIENKIEIEKVDFPQRKIQTKSEKNKNEEIAEKYQFDGSFPTLILARKDTLFYKKLNYNNQNLTQIKNEILNGLKQLQ